MSAALGVALPFWLDHTDAEDRGRARRRAGGHARVHRERTRRVPRAADQRPGRAGRGRPARGHAHRGRRGESEPGDDGCRQALLEPAHLSVPGHSAPWQRDVDLANRGVGGILGYLYPPALYAEPTSAWAWGSILGLVTNWQFSGSITLQWQYNCCQIIS